jgi:hypothetical protein
MDRAPASHLVRILTASAASSLVLALAACGGPKVEGTDTVEVAAAPGAAIVVETFSTSATVAAMDTKDRKFTLQFADGKKSTFKAPPEMVNYGQLNVGDRVDAVVTERAVIGLAKNGGPPSSGALGGAVLSPVGAKPGGVAVAAAEITATVTAVNPAKRKVTLQFDTGKPETLKVSKDIDLSNVQVGDQVVAVVTEGVAITVTKGT